MPRSIQKIWTAREVAAETKPGLHCIGHGLYLRVGRTGGKSWIFRYMLNKRRHDMGLGELRLVSLADARKRAHAIEIGLLDGIDPLSRRRDAAVAAVAARKVVTLEECVHTYAREQLTGRDPQTVKTFVNGLSARVLPALGKRDVASITSDDVVEVFRPIWGGAGAMQTRRTLRNLARVFGWAKANKLRSDNPVDWGELKHRLPALAHTSRRMPSLDWRRVGEFMAELRRRDGVPYRALELTILTGLRTDEVREASWGEIDQTLAKWIIPAKRMKMKRTHLVPLTGLMLDLLDRMQVVRQEGGWVFPGLAGRPIHAKAMYKVAKEVAEAIGVDPASVTTHGFRATLFAWKDEGTRGEAEGYTDKLVNLVIAHKPQDKVQAAYDYAEMLDKRREFLEHWGRVCGSPTALVVVPLAGRL